MQQTVSDYLLHWLSAVGCKHLFMVPGSHLDPLFRSVTAPESPVKPIIATHELSAAYMADGYGRYRHDMGVVAVIGGPGTSHLMTAVLAAARDQKPLLVITGDVPQGFSDWPVFQNAGVTGTHDLKSFSGLMHGSVRLETPRDLPYLLCDAWQKAMSAPYGPVHLQIPSNLFTASLDDLDVLLPKAYLRQKIPGVEYLRMLLQQTSHLLCYAGSALFSVQSECRLEQLLRSTGVPLVTTVCRRGLLPESDLLSQGAFGFAGQSQARDAVFSEQVQVLLILGVELTDRNTLNWSPHFFAAYRKVILVNPSCPDAVLEAFPCLEWIAADPEEVLNALYIDPPRPDVEVLEQRDRWVDALTSEKRDRQQARTLPEPSAELLSVLFSALRAELPSDTPIFVDAGLSKLYVGIYWQAEKPGTVFLSAQTGAMGWALGAALGAAFAVSEVSSEQRVIVVTGDGSLQMQGMELITAVRYHLPITFIVLNNQSLGSVALRMPEQAHAHAVLQTSEVNWQAFAASLGMPAVKISQYTEVPAFSLQHKQVSGPVLLEVLIELPQNLEHPEFLKAAFS